MEFSKKIIIAVSILTAIVFLFSMAAMIYLQDLSSLSVLITTAAAAFTTGAGFYYNKAKAENLKKLSQEIQKEELDEESIKKAKMIMSEDVEQYSSSDYDY